MLFRSVRGITVGFYPTNPAAEVAYLLGDCGASVHLAEDEEQYDKVDEIGREKLADVRSIIFVEPRGMIGKDDERLLFWDNFLELGREHKAQHPNAVADRMAADFGSPCLDVLVHSLANGPEVQNALIDTSRSGYLAALSASAYSLVSMVQRFGPLMSEGEIGRAHV